jgi:hypothetical protein
MAQIFENSFHGLRVYAEEHYLDLNDFDEPFKTREVALSIILFPILERHSEAQLILLNVNEATLVDSPFYSDDLPLAQAQSLSFFSM